MNENKTNINWYPGHMAKAKREIQEELKNIDIIYELVDARIPYSSKIKDIDNIIKSSNKILIITKKDLCDINITKYWISYYEKLGYKVLLVELTNNKDYQTIIKTTHEITKHIQDKRIERGLKPKEIKALVIGIPNVGKSTLINKIVGKKVVNVENKPGVTKNLTYLPTQVGITLLDTPGILWPKLANATEALNIAAIGSIKKEILNIDEVSGYILNFLAKNYPEILLEKYNINDYDMNNMYETIAKKIGAFKNNEINFEKVSLKVYTDLVSGNIKGITLDNEVINDRKN